MCRVCERAVLRPEVSVNFKLLSEMVSYKIWLVVLEVICFTFYHKVSQTDVGNVDPSEISKFLSKHILVNCKGGGALISVKAHYSWQYLCFWIQTKGSINSVFFKFSCSALQSYLIFSLEILGITKSIHTIGNSHFSFHKQSYLSGELLKCCKILEIFISFTTVTKKNM